MPERTAELLRRLGRNEHAAGLYLARLIDGSAVPLGALAEEHPIDVGDPLFPRFRELPEAIAALFAAPAPEAEEARKPKAPAPQEEEGRRAARRDRVRRLRQGRLAGRRGAQGRRASERRPAAGARGRHRRRAAPYHRRRNRLQVRPGRAGRQNCGDRGKSQACGVARRGIPGHAARRRRKGDRRPGQRRRRARRPGPAKTLKSCVTRPMVRAYTRTTAGGPPGLVGRKTMRTSARNLLHLFDFWGGHP